MKNTTKGSKKLPKTLLLGLDQYNIIYKDELEHSDLGAVIFKAHEIKVSTKHNPVEQRRTLLHEIIHICLAHAGIYGDDAEEICRQLEYTLFEALVKNPDVTRYISEG